MANQEDICSESGSCANSVKTIRLSLVPVRVVQTTAVLVIQSLSQIVSPGHRYDEPSEPNDQLWGGYGKCRLNGESAAASFPTACCVDSASRTDAMASGGPCVFASLPLTKLGQLGSSTGTLFAPGRGLWTMGVLLSPNNWRVRVLRPDGCGNV